LVCWNALHSIVASELLSPEQSLAAETFRLLARRGGCVLYTLAVVLLILWAVGVIGGYVLGAFVHLLLIVAIALILIQFLSGRRASI